MIGALLSRQELPVPVDDVLLTQSATSLCNSDLVTPPCDVTATPEVVDVSDVMLTVPVPVATVGVLPPPVDSNQTVSSLVSLTAVTDRIRTTYSHKHHNKHLSHNCSLNSLDFKSHQKPRCVNDNLTNVVREFKA